MRIIGIDFTSRPSRRKPLTAAFCTLAVGRLTFDRLEAWTSFDGFEAVLRAPGPWVAGLDFPFGLSRRFVEGAGWPGAWTDYVRHARGLGRPGFRAALNAYRADRAAGDKEHRRATDIAAGAISPQKLYGVPVALMFFEGAARLIDAGVTVPHLLRGDPDRIVVEAYPGVLVRQLVGRRSYKSDTRHRQTAEHSEARRDILDALRGDGFRTVFGFTVDADPALATDPSGDSLDALLCAAQAAWAFGRRQSGFGAPPDVDPLEGWIACTPPEH